MANANRIVNNVFTSPSALEKIGVAYHALVKSSTLLMEWTSNKIYRSATAFEPVKGITTPYILNMMITAGSEFFPNAKERVTVICGSLFVFEEPFAVLEDDDLTMVTVIEEFKKILLTDNHLVIGGGGLKAERLKKFELASYGGKVHKDSVTIHNAYRTEYIVDLNYQTRNKM